MKYLGSAFSLQMLPKGGRLEVERVGPLSEEGYPNSTVHIYRLVAVEGRRAIRSPEWDRATVGHEGTAQELSRLLGVPISVSRESISLEVGDTLWVAQPIGKRIEYGKELDAPALVLYEVRVLPREEPAPKANLDLASNESLWGEVFRREDRNPAGMEAAKKTAAESY